LKEASTKTSEVTSGDPDFDLWAYLFQTRDVIYNVRTNELRPLGVTLMDAAVMFFINYLGERATPAEISRWLFRRHHTILGQLTRMERKGLVTTTKGKLQKNVISVRFTEKGKEVFKKASANHSHHIIFASLNKEDRMHLWTILGKLQYAGLKELGKEHTMIFPKPPH
jgi:DNA-binding MarR family transcriptional regulator